ncbi:vesicular integral-membrane protein VIP36-like [Halichondria panicea]|uniref:vesicular integral-membrane protein VIP36-like n=1 Tax=Halichondria panicea TaxID=6063 RepID=UPI00312B9D3D
MCTIYSSSAFLLVVCSLLSLVFCAQDAGQMIDSIEQDGYYRREYSLTQPYHGTGMDVPNWEFGGSTVVSTNYVRLTPDRQSKNGMLWNTVPVVMHNWEILIHFAVHGQGKTLFGDGSAIWYTKERGEKGPVLGNRDYFTGLGVFLDTYSNHNGEHVHDHPYISAMVNNGSVHYDHDRDGTHSQMAGCSVKFRNSQQDTFVAISYINRQVMVMTNIDGNDDWKTCFVVNDVDLPTGYYFGATAATGDLADNHDIISVRVYDVDDNSDEPDFEAPDWSTIKPKAKNAESPRDHVKDVQGWLSPKAYQIISIVLIIVLVLGVITAVVGGFAFVKHQEKNKKRFF